MPEVDFDFQAYVAARRGADEGLARGGPAAYAFTGEQKRLRALARMKPVALAAEATVRHWRGRAREELLASAAHGDAGARADVEAAVEAAAARLGLAIPGAHLVPGAGGVLALGTREEAAVVVDAALLPHLGPLELRFAAGAACGQIQAGHVLYVTTLHHLERSAGLFLRWVVRPAAMALRGWRRRAVITTDRAGLLAAGDLDAALDAMAKLELGPDALAAGADPLAALAGRDGHAHLALRAEALRRFARTFYYLNAAGDPDAAAGSSLTRCDAEVTALLAGRPPRQEAADA